MIIRFTAAFCLLCLLSVLNVFAQSEDIYYPQGPAYVDSLAVTKPQPSALKLQKNSDHGYQKPVGRMDGLSAVLGYAGGFMLGYTFTNAILRKGDPNWYMVGGGVGLSFLALQLRSASHKRSSSKAGDLHRVPQASNLNPAIQLGYHAQGLGIQITF